MGWNITVAAAVGAIALQPLAAAADGKAEIATASDHAGYAVSSLTIEAVQEHLHHALNCLDGPHGVYFKSSFENPCAKMGAGAIPDAGDSATRQTLQAAEAAAALGVRTADEIAAKKGAADAYALLRSIK